MKSESIRWMVYALVAVAAGACSHADLGRTMSTWQGSHIDEVVAAWGQPAACETIEGRRICAWHDLVSGYSLSTSPMCVRSLEVNHEGVVTGWRWRGDQCYETAGRVLARTEHERPDALAAQSPAGDDVGVAVTRPAE